MNAVLEQPPESSRVSAPVVRTIGAEMRAASEAGKCGVPGCTKTQVLLLVIGGQRATICEEHLDNLWSATQRAIGTTATGRSLRGTA